MILEQESRDEGNQIHHPQVCKTSVKLCQDKREGQVYDRLYQISKDRQAKQIWQIIDTPEAQIDLHDANMKEATFAPKINQKSEDIVRDRPVQDLLYDDALRR